MSGVIKKIDLIKSMAVFKEFNWDKEIRDPGNNVAEFKRINIIYGRNYSGKTTLSRIIRAFETYTMPDNYEDPQFKLTLADGDSITQDSLLSHNQVIRVYNEDFIKENLRFIIDDEQNIKPFAVLGEDNNKVEEQIKAIETELGSEEKATNLYGKLKSLVTAHSSAKKNYRDANSNLEDKLRDKSNKAGTGIKHNKIYGDVNYNVIKLRKDIEKIMSENYIVIDDEIINKYFELLKEEAKQSIPESSSFNLTFEVLSKKTKELVEKRISVSNLIQDLLDNATLQAWVREGRAIHESNKRKTCGFCGSLLPKDLWDKLDRHFNKESEQLIINIEQLIEQIESEKKRISLLFNIRSSEFYSHFVNEINKIKTDFERTSTKYCTSLDELTDMLKQRQGDIFTPLIYIQPENHSKVLNEIRDMYENLRIQSNTFTSSLSSKQKEARNALRLKDVHSFVVDIKYKLECKRIEQLSRKLLKAKEELNLAQDLIDKKRKDILELKLQLNDEKKGADRINRYLNDFFGHKYLTLEAIANAENEESMSGYRFEVTRGGKIAYHLSKGECSLISFCYFMAKLDDVETEGKKPIIWIDDPISSLDSNHIFFVYSLISSEILNAEKYKQIFISTHNLDFLKYLKCLPGGLNKKISQYFIIQRYGEWSSIKLMPNYLKDYVTEFNYLFHQIYKCAKADITKVDNYDCYYNFGNNARKFLEAFLYFKYPNAKKKDDKLIRFFGNDALSSSLTDRINNEYSHLAGLFERSIKPIDVPEMKSTAEFILKKIKQRDIDQYNALLHSIGEEEEEKEEEEEEEFTSSSKNATPVRIRTNKKATLNKTAQNYNGVQGVQGRLFNVE